MADRALTNVTPAIPWRLDPNTGCLGLILIALAAYAIAGKGFAIVGLPPLFIGEVVLALGLLALLRSGCWIAVLTSLPSLFLAALMCWVIARTVPYISTYSFDALRDSVIVTYGLFGFVVIALMLEKPARLEWTINVYGRFAWLYGSIGGTLFIASAYFDDLIPKWPSSGVSIVAVRPGEAASHLAGAAVFMLLGFRRVTVIWSIALLLNVMMITPSRGAMLAWFVPVGFAVVASGQLRRFMPVLFLCGAIFAIGYALGISVPLSGGRSAGPVQIVNNIESIFDSSDKANLDGTKTWRLRWWQAIQGYTFEGPYFWAGKGFGINLAEADGFMVGEENGGPPLRSPHNAHMTILARAGVPGLALWIVVGVSWFGVLMRNMTIARRRDNTDWANLFLWIACYGIAIMINSSFDVALEGPMSGIWFWCIFGLGIASSMIYRAQLLHSAATDRQG